MSVYFDHDPINGTVQTYDYDPVSDSHMITTHQDISGILDTLQKARNDPEYWKKAVKEEWVHFATIPSVVEMELKKKGLNLYDKNATKRIMQEIERNYPYLKAVDKNLV
jgi:hypothetical protein